MTEYESTLGFWIEQRRLRKRGKQEMKVRRQLRKLIPCCLLPASCLWMPAHSPQMPHFFSWWRRLISKYQYLKTSMWFPLLCSSAQAWCPKCDTSRNNFSFRVVWESHPDLSCCFLFVDLCSLTVTSSQWVPDVPPALYSTHSRNTEIGLSASGVSVLLRRTDL